MPLLLVEERRAVAGDPAVHRAALVTRSPRSEDVAPLEHDVRAGARLTLRRRDRALDDVDAVVARMPVRRRDRAGIPHVEEHDVARAQLDPLLLDADHAAVRETDLRHLHPREILDVDDARSTVHGRCLQVGERPCQMRTNGP